MDQASNYFNMPTQIGPPAPPPPPQPYMGEQFQQQYHEDYNFHHEQHPPADPIMDAVNTEVWAAVQAYYSMDAQSLHQAYANLGFVLGIDRACTYFIQSYSSANPAYGGSRRTAKLFFKKDWENLEAMVSADIDNEKKIVHVEEFMKRRHIPGYVSLYAPKQIVCKGVDKSVKQEKISRVDDACHTRNEVMLLDVACQTQDQSVISLNVACQTEKFRSLETGCQTERFVSLESSCQTECFVSLDVACKTLEKSAGLSVSCQTTDTCKKSSSDSVDKVVRKDSDNRKRVRDDKQDSRSTKRSKHSDSTGDARNKASSQDTKSSTQNGSGRTEESENKSRAKDDKIVCKESNSQMRPRDHEAETSATSGQHPILNARLQRAMRIVKSLCESKKKLIEAIDNEKSTHACKDSSDNCKRDRDDKSKTHSVSHSKCSDSKDSSQKRETAKGSSSKTYAVEGKRSSRKSSDKIVPRNSSDNCKRARSNKSETCSTNRSESHAKRSNLKDSTQKCEPTKKSVSKSVSRRTTEAVDSKKSSRDSVVTSKVLNDPKDGGGAAETKRSSSQCKQNSESSDCHVTKLVIQNLHPLVNDADISTIFSVFKSYKSSKVNFCNYGEMGVAEVVFEDKADALDAEKQFDGKNLDGFPMNIVLVKSEKN